MIKDVFQMKGKECNDQERLKIEQENLCQSEEGALAWDKQISLGQWKWTRRVLWLPRKIQWKRKESRKSNDTPQGMWPVEVVASGSAMLTLCLENRKVGSQVVGVDRSRLFGRER